MFRRNKILCRETLIHKNNQIRDVCYRNPVFIRNFYWKEMSLGILVLGFRKTRIPGRANSYVKFNIYPSQISFGKLQTFFICAKIFFQFGIRVYLLQSYSIYTKNIHILNITYYRNLKFETVVLIVTVWFRRLSE